MEEDKVKTTDSGSEVESRTEEHKQIKHVRKGEIEPLNALAVSLAQEGTVIWRTNTAVSYTHLTLPTIYSV